jgi:hypothetical protein
MSTSRPVKEKALEGSPESPSPDSRRDQRFQVEAQAVIYVADQRLTAKTRDVSLSGMCLVSTEAIARDTAVRVELVVSFGANSKTEPLRLTGRAIWCTKMFGLHQVGVMFVDVDDEQYRHLHLFMQFLDGDFGGARGRGAEEPGNNHDDDPFAL